MFGDPENLTYLCKSGQSPAAHRRAHVGKTPRDRARRLHCSSSRLRSHSPQPLLVRMRDIRTVSNGTRPRCRSCRQDCQDDRHRHQPYATPPATKRGQTTTPPLNTRKGPVQHEQGPPHKNYCGSHLLSHNHQVAVPSARMGLATGIGTVNRAFPHHYHHRKTNRPPHPTHQSGGSSPRTAQRTRTPQTMQPPHTKGGLATNEHTTHSRTHQPKKVNE